MSKRYKPVGNWRPIGKYSETHPFVFGGDAKYLRHITIEVSDLTETGPFGSVHIWTDGAYRVTVTGPRGHPRSKTMIGEMAWCSARRYAEDVVSAFRKFDQTGSWK